MDPRGAATPDDDFNSARRALDRGDLTEAMRRVAGALGEDPNHPEALPLLDEIIAADPDPLQLAPVDSASEPSSSIKAVHAYILSGQGRLGEAVDMLLDVIVSRPDVLYLDWILGWLQRPEAAGKLDMTKMAWFIGSLTEQFAALSAPYGGGRATLDRLPFFIQLIRRTQQPDTQFQAASVGMLRRLGHGEEAMKLAREAYAKEPGFQTAMAIAQAHEGRNDVDLALRAYQDALRFEPEDLNARMGMADLMANRNRVAEAIEVYKEILDREPDHDGALPSYYFLRFITDGKETWRNQLLDLAEADADNERARSLAQQVAPYIGYLPEPADAASNLLRAMGERGPGERRLTAVCLNRVEAPSNYLAFDELKTMPVTVTRIQSPDPRVPRAPVDYLLWRYEGTKPAVAVAPPDVHVASAVVEMAQQQYHLDAWRQMARRLANQMKPEHVADLLATMVYPPRPPQVARPAGWVYRVQVAAALVIAHLDTGWEGSVRKKALFSLVNGPMDWTVDAALLALSTVAREDDDACIDIDHLFRDLRQELPEDGGMCYHGMLLWCSLRLPNLPDEDRDDLRRRLREWRTTQEAQPHFQKALEHAENGEHDKGIEELSEAVQIHPDFAEAFEARANLYLRARTTTKQAIADFTQVIRLLPESGSAFLGRGQAFLKLGKFDLAIDDFSSAVRLMPDGWHPYLRRGLAHAAKKQHDLAIVDFTRVIELNPELPEAYLYRAFAHTDRGGCEQAIQDFTEHLRLNPRNAAACNFRARLHCRTGNYRAAIADHLQACELDPANGNTHNHLAWIWATCPQAELRDGPRALKYATEACELTTWKQPHCLDTLAAACATCGRFEEAVQRAEQAVELASESEKADYRSRLDLYRAGQAYHTT
ncbi:MAG: tetratricopeptide repeat protein [Gemmataceae bacterium]|nr:tetratricopeptide repeat protein [Gemmataceae bacterium]